MLWDFTERCKLLTFEKTSTDSAMSKVPNDVFERFQRLIPFSGFLRQDTPAKSNRSYDSRKLLLIPTDLQY